MKPTRSELVQIVECSPRHVAAHDREAWLGLFTDEAKIEDPVGSAPAHKYNGELERFWNTFIAPNEIRFEVRRDHVVGNTVMRDAVIHTKVSGSVQVDVEAYLLYVVDTETTPLRVVQMSAHWSLAKMTWLAVTLGPRAWWPLTVMFVRMFKNMGFRWVWRYLASLWQSVGRRGITAAETLARALCDRDLRGVLDLFAPDGEVALGEETFEPSRFFELVGDRGRLRIEAPISAGATTSFRYVIEGERSSEGLCLLEFNRRDVTIQRARFFPAGV